MKALVVILNKNNAEGLKRCLQSLLAQTAKIGEDFDVLVLDGASEDASEDVAKEFDGVKFKVQEKLGGTGYARVEACMYAIKEDYDAIIWGDSENVYSEEYVEEMLKGLEDADVVGGIPIVEGGFFAHAFAWYHAIHVIIPMLARKHIPGNNRGERVGIFEKVMYPESRRAEDYGFTLLLMKKGIKLRQKIVNGRVYVSLPETAEEVHKWQVARAKGAAEAAHYVGVFPFDSLVWFFVLLPFPLFLILPLLSTFLFFLLFLTSLAIFARSLKYIRKPRMRYFFAPFVGLLLYSIYTVISLFHYLRLKTF